MHRAISIDGVSWSVCVCLCLCHDLQKRLYRSRNHSGLDLHGPKEFRIPATLFIADNRMHGACADDEARSSAAAAAEKLAPNCKAGQCPLRWKNTITCGPITIAIRARFEYDSSAIRARYNIVRGVMCFRAIMNMSILSRCCRML